jgi:ANTAR domain
MARPVIVRSTTARTSAPLTANEELAALRRENAALRQTLEARTVVERAKALLMTQGGLSEPHAHRYIQKSSMDARMSMAEVARALILAIQAHRGPVTSAQIRRSPWPAATPRLDSFPDAFVRSLAGRLGTRRQASRASGDSHGRLHSP